MRNLMGQGLVLLRLGQTLTVPNLPTEKHVKLCMVALVSRWRSHCPINDWSVSYIIITFDLVTVEGWPLSTLATTQARALISAWYCPRPMKAVLKEMFKLRREIP